jgi:toxin ParE1/3/4
MPIHWSEDALADLEALRAYIARHSERGAGRVVLTILSHIAHLKTQPHIGRPGRVPGTRELLARPAPCIVPYRVKGEVIEILRVLHTAQAWPDAF